MKWMNKVAYLSNVHVLENKPPHVIPMIDELRMFFFAGGLLTLQETISSKCRGLAIIMILMWTSYFFQGSHIIIYHMCSMHTKNLPGFSVCLERSWVDEHFRLITLWWRWNWHWNVNECLNILISFKFWCLDLPNGSRAFRAFLDHGRVCAAHHVFSLLRVAECDSFRQGRRNQQKKRISLGGCL